MSIIQVSASIRKALQRPLVDRMMAVGPFLPSPEGTKPALHIEGLAFDSENLALEKYVRLSIAISKIAVTEMGATPRIEAHGFITLGIYTLWGTGEDVSDEVAKLVGVPYVYNTPLVEDGITVRVLETEARDFAKDRRFMFKPWVIRWDVLRT